MNYKEKYYKYKKKYLALKEQHGGDPTDDGEGCSCNGELCLGDEDFFGKICVNYYPVQVNGNYYFLNIAQKAMYDSIMNLSLPLVYWSACREKVRNGDTPMNGNALLRVVEGLPRGAMAIIHMQLNTITYVARGGAGGNV